MTEVLNQLRNNRAHSDRQDVEEFSEAAQGLRSCIETNLDLEPEWAKTDLRDVKAALDVLTEQASKWLDGNNSQAFKDFALTCRCQRGDRYSKFTGGLRTLSSHRPEWHYEKCK